MQTKEPYTERDYEKINEHLRNLEGLKVDIERALAAGFDCGPEDQKCQELKDRFAQIKKAYFPERP